MKPARWLLKNQSGSFLLSTLVLMGVMSVVFTAVWQIVGQKRESWMRVKTLNSRDLVMTAGLRNSRVASFYYKTILENDAVNDAFIKCLLPDAGVNDCVAVSAGKPVTYPMRLIDETDQVVMGNKANPTLYDIFGQTCTTPSITCPFFVYAEFTPACKDSTAECDQAWTIDVTVNVGVQSAFSSSFPGIQKSSTTQIVAIANFVDSFYPVLPPPTDYGTPITDGSGYNGWIAKQVTDPGGDGGAGGGGGGGGAPPPLPPTISCKAGEAASGKACRKFRF